MKRSNITPFFNMVVFMAMLFPVFAGAINPTEPNAAAEQRLCYVPTNLYVNTIAGTSVKLNWTGTNGAIHYQIQIMNESSTPYYWKQITYYPVQSYTATGLLPYSGYRFRVRKQCGTNDWSQWAQWKPFNTGAPLGMSIDTESDEAAATTNAATELSVRPNPADQVLTIDLASASVADRSRVSLFDMTGKLVLESAVPAGEYTHQLDVSTLQNGVYVLRFSDGELVQTRKVVVTH